MGETTIVWWSLLLALTIGGASWLLFLRRQGRAGPNGDCCARCGYSTVGLPSSICPECGGNLKLIGMRKATTWNRLNGSVRRRWMLAAWTIIFSWGAALAAVPLLNHVCPREVFTCATSIFQPVATATRPASLPGAAPSACVISFSMARREVRPPGAINLSADAAGPIVAWQVRINDDGWGGSESGSAIIGLRPPTAPRQVSFLFSLRDQRATWIDSEAGRLASQDGDWRGPLNNWFARQESRLGLPGLGPACEAVLEAALAGQTPASAAASQASIALRPFGSGSSYGSRADRRFVGAGLGLALLVWLIGCVVISRGERSGSGG